MVLMEWTYALSVNLNSIDDQHKKLFNYMNELYDALVARKEREILSKIFQELEDYTKTHFSFEEEKFIKFDYIGKDAHMLQHKEFINKLAVMKKQIAEDVADVEDLLDFLVQWLIHHIKGTDHGYIECFKEHGVK
jgi:hemerythrin